MRTAALIDAFNIGSYWSVLLGLPHFLLYRRRQDAATNMHATVMYLAILFPDWNSLQSVRRAHSDLEGTALVFFALLVVFEALAHLTENKKREKLFDRIGIVFFAVAVLAEIAAYPYGQRNDELSQAVIGSLDSQVKEAKKDASEAVDDSKKAVGQATDALTKSGNAEKSLGKAENEAKGAQAASSNAVNEAAKALNLATGARTEADTFGSDIKSAKQQATTAEQHLADALREAAQAQAELNRIRSPRSLVNRDKLIAALKPFGGTEYILNVFLDQESTEFIKTVAGALDASGWIRKQPQGMNIGVPTMQIDFGKGLEFVPSCIESGIGIHVQTKESLSVLQTIPFANLPKNVQTSLILKTSMAESISPEDARNVQEGTIDPEPGEVLSVRVCVGKKP